MKTFCYKEKLGRKLLVEYVESLDGIGTLAVVVGSGGWVGNDWQSCDVPIETRNSLQELGCSLAIVEYRTSDVEPFPAQLEDIRDALSFIKDKRDEWDYERIVLVGISGGATLATLLSFKSTLGQEGYGDLGMEEIPLVLVSGPFDLLALDNALGNFVCMTNHYAKGTDLDRFVGGRLLEDSKAGAQACPASFAEKGMKLPPILMFHGVDDHVHNLKQAFTFAHELHYLSPKNQITMVSKNGAGHGWKCVDEGMFKAFLSQQARLGKDRYTRYLGETIVIDRDGSIIACERWDGFCYQVQMHDWKDPIEANVSMTEYRSFYSKTLRKYMSYQVYLPPSYHTSKDKKYPVSYYYYGARSNQRVAGYFTQNIDNALKSGQGLEMIIVSPNIPKKFRTKVKFCDRLFRKDIAPHVEETYRVIDDRRYRLIEGSSMGSYNTFHIGFSNIDYFGMIQISDMPIELTTEICKKKLVEKKTKKFSKELLQETKVSFIGTAFGELADGVKSVGERVESVGLPLETTLLQHPKLPNFMFHKLSETNPFNIHRRVLAGMLPEPGIVSDVERLDAEPGRYAIYAKSGADLSKANAILYFHACDWRGQLWFQGDETEVWQDLITDDASVLVSVGYRSEEPKSLSQRLDDCVANIENALENLRQKGCEVASLSVFGMSAGSVIANYLVCDYLPERIDRMEQCKKLYDMIKAVVSYGGVFSFSDLDSQRLRNCSTRRMFFDGPESPLKHLDSKFELQDSSRMFKPYDLSISSRYDKPTYVIHGARDEVVPCMQGGLLYEALQQKGVETCLDIEPELGHGDYRLDAKKVNGFFSRALASKPVEFPSSSFSKISVCGSGYDASWSDSLKTVNSWTQITSFRSESLGADVDIRFFCPKECNSWDMPLTLHIPGLGECSRDYQGLSHLYHQAIIAGSVSDRMVAYLNVSPLEFVGSGLDANAILKFAQSELSDHLSSICSISCRLDCLVAHNESRYVLGDIMREVYLPDISTCVVVNRKFDAKLIERMGVNVDRSYLECDRYYINRSLKIFESKKALSEASCEVIELEPDACSTAFSAAMGKFDLLASISSCGASERVAVST